MNPKCGKNIRLVLNTQTQYRHLHEKGSYLHFFSFILRTITVCGVNYVRNYHVI